jgi:hypothetical protein
MRLCYDEHSIIHIIIHTFMKTDKKSRRMQLVIPEWLHAELQKKADAMGINVSEAAREAIREFVKQV